MHIKSLGSQVMITIVGLHLLFLLGISTPALADGPYRGRVIDAETKEPIKDAVVVAIWSREVFAWIQSNSRFEYAREVLTNANGEFVISGLSLSRHIRLFLDPFTWLDHGQPWFFILKPGYGWYPKYQMSPIEKSKPHMVKLFKNYVIIELPKLEIPLSPEAREKRKRELPDCPLVGSDPSRKLSSFIPAYLNYMNSERSFVLGPGSDIQC